MTDSDFENKAIPLPLRLLPYILKKPASDIQIITKHKREEL